MANRSKLIGPLVKTREQAAEMAGEVAGLTLERQTTAAQMEKKLDVVRKQYENELDELDKAIERGTDVLRSWAVQNLEEFGSARSIQFARARVGFLLHKHNMTPLPQAKKQIDAIIMAIFAKGGRYSKDYLDVKTTLNKDRIIEELKAQGKDAPVLAEIGLGISQREQFFVEPIREQLAVEASKSASTATATA
jgi:phage host-nuclease inhibitor protein Gam